jgi:hypothetical protein
MGVTTRGAQHSPAPFWLADYWQPTMLVGLENPPKNSRRNGTLTIVGAAAMNTKNWPSSSRAQTSGSHRPQRLFQFEQRAPVEDLGMA